MRGDDAREQLRGRAAVATIQIACGRVRRYRVAVGERHVRVGLAAVANDDALATLSGTDNQFSITTRRYQTSNPLVITGPGAGVDVTAAGVVNDVLGIAAAR